VPVEHLDLVFEAPCRNLFSGARKRGVISDGGARGAR
jgi:hypothetical protein